MPEKTKIVHKDCLPDQLTAQHIADYLGISRDTVYNLFNVKPDFGGIKNYSIGTSRRADKEDFFDWLEQQKNKTA